MPQGTVLGPVLFLVFINDIPDSISSPIRLFADDCVIYRKIETPQDSQALQQDLTRVGNWETTWLMEFNVKKCHTIRITRQRERNIITSTYYLHNSPLEIVSSAKYLGITISHDLDWKEHIGNITAKANRTLGFIRRNLPKAPQQVKAIAYKTLVRPQLENAAPIWHPYDHNNITPIEKSTEEQTDGSPTDSTIQVVSWT